MWKTPQVIRVVIGGPDPDNSNDVEVTAAVRFVAADMPDANDLTVGIMALVAEQGARGDLPAHQGGSGGRQARGVRFGQSPTAPPP